MSETEQDQQQSVQVSLPVDWYYPEGIQSRYANNMLAQAGAYEITLSFFEVQPPPLTGSPEENKEKLSKLSAIRAECVSKIVVPPELIPAIINVLQQELEKYQASHPNQ